MLWYQTRNSERVMLWAVDDTLVLKWLALQLGGKLPVHERCEHRKHGGGVKASVRRLHHAIRDEDYTFVYRTDIRGYYRHIRKPQVDTLFCRNVGEPILWNLFRQYLYYRIEDGGEIETPKVGIAWSCSLSPLVGASLLYHYDGDFGQREGIYYARYMDDFMVFAKICWHLRRSIQRLNEYMDIGGFEVHPDKTYIDRIQHGFDLLGVYFDGTGIT